MSAVVPNITTVFDQPSVTQAVSQPKWLVGLLGTWFVLTVMVEVDDLRPLGKALALVILGSVALSQGPTALQNLGFSTTGSQSSLGAPGLKLNPGTPGQ